MTDFDMYKCSVCGKRPPHIGSMCESCWKAAQGKTAATLECTEENPGQ